MRYLIFVLFFSFALPLVGQFSLEGSKNNDAAVLVGVSYGLELPMGDLKERFQNNFAIGLDVGYTAAESPWTFSLQTKYFFGNQVNQDVLEGLRTDAGFIVGTNRLPADIQLRMRGLYAGVQVGKIFSLGGDNFRSGIRLALGLGYLSHRIRIQLDPQQTVNQLVGDYSKGYDRLSAGPSINQFVGYYQLSENGRVNFYFGIEATEAFTTNQRSYDFATAGTLDENRLDISIGFRAGLIIPLYMGSGEDIYYR